MKPDYQGNSIVNLMASIVAGCGGAPTGYPTLPALEPARIERARSVVLLVIDALGHRHLHARHGGSRLAEHSVACMTSVFPSTTATAVTTFLTGVAPQQHAVTGWFTYFRELGAVIAVLPYRARYGGATLDESGLDAATLLEPTPVFDRIAVESHTVIPEHIAYSPFNRAHTGRASVGAFASLSGLFANVEAAIGASDAKKYIYAYWPGLDGVGHTLGMESRAAERHFHEIDRAFSRFLHAVRGTDTLVIVTADHGQMDGGPGYHFVLNDHPAIRNTLALPLCGESRVAYCYVRAGREREFEEAVARELGEAMSVQRSGELLEQGYFGCGEPHPRLADRIGDYVLVMNGRHSIRDQLLGEEPVQHIGNHGGTSEQEMLVPLILAEP